jgi:hypothetical protein
MNELEEITNGKSLKELEMELIFQQEKMGESLGGAICSHIVHQIELAKPQRLIVRSLGQLFYTYLFKSEEKANLFMEENKSYELLCFGEGAFYVSSCESIDETPSMDIVGIDDIIDKLMAES